MAEDFANKSKELGKSLLSSRRAFTLCLDALLLFVFVLLLSPRMTGLPLHEWIGIAFCVPVLVHLLIARPWIEHTTKRLFRGADRRVSVNYFLNTTLFVLMVLEIVSGLVISQVAVPSIGIDTINDRSWRALHNLTLNWALLIVGLHIAMNWEWIVSALRRHLSPSAMLTAIQRPPAPSIGRALRWIGLEILAAGFVAAVTLATFGPPSAARLYRQDEVARFTPTLGHGVGQFTGEAFLIGLVAYIGRRWLRVRL